MLKNIKDIQEIFQEKNETEDGKNKTSKENEMVNLVDTFDENN